MKALVFHPLAESEVLRAASFYLRAGPALVLKFRFRLNETLQRIQSNPLAYAAESNGDRIAPIKKFPYKVVYRELANHIWIAAVGHHSRRPKYWSRRKP